MSIDVITKDETVPTYLARIRRKADDKGMDHWRTTREVSDYFGWRMDLARKRLTALHDANEIDCARSGKTLLWRAKPAESKS